MSPIVLFPIAIGVNKRRQLWNCSKLLIPCVFIVFFICSPCIRNVCTLCAYYRRLNFCVKFSHFLFYFFLLVSLCLLWSFHRPSLQFQYCLCSVFSTFLRHILCYYSFMCSLGLFWFIWMIVVKSFYLLLSEFQTVLLGFIAISLTSELTLSFMCTNPIFCDITFYIGGFRFFFEIKSETSQRFPNVDRLNSKVRLNKLRFYWQYYSKVNVFSYNIHIVSIY